MAVISANKSTEYAQYGKWWGKGGKRNAGTEQTFLELFKYSRFDSQLKKKSRDFHCADCHGT